MSSQPRPILRLTTTLLSLLSGPAQSQRNLAPFLAGTVPFIRHPSAQRWTQACLDERRELYAERGEQAIEWEGVELGERGPPTVGSEVHYERS